jgi:hypothetical protein
MPEHGKPEFSAVARPPSLRTEQSISPRRLFRRDERLGHLGVIDRAPPVRSPVIGPLKSKLQIERNLCQLACQRIVAQRWWKSGQMAGASRNGSMPGNGLGMILSLQRLPNAPREIDSASALFP